MLLLCTDLTYLFPQVCPICHTGITHDIVGHIADHRRMLKERSQRHAPYLGSACHRSSLLDRPPHSKDLRGSSRLIECDLGYCDESEELNDLSLQGSFASPLMTAEEASSSHCVSSSGKQVLSLPRMQDVPGTSRSASTWQPASTTPATKKKEPGQPEGIEDLQASFAQHLVLSTLGLPGL